MGILVLYIDIYIMVILCYYDIMVLWYCAKVILYYYIMELWKTMVLCRLCPLLLLKVNVIYYATLKR